MTYFFYSLILPQISLLMKPLEHQTSLSFDLLLKQLSHSFEAYIFHEAIIVYSLMLYVLLVNPFQVVLFSNITSLSMSKGHYRNNFSYSLTRYYKNKSFSLLELFLIIREVLRCVYFFIYLLPSENERNVHHN